MVFPHRSARWLLWGVASVVACIACTRLADAPAAIAVTRVGFGPIESWVTTNGVIEPGDPHVIRAPVTVFVADDGRVVHVHRGEYHDAATLRGDVARFLQVRL